MRVRSACASLRGALRHGCAPAAGALAMGLGLIVLLGPSVGARGSEVIARALLDNYSQGHYATVTQSLASDEGAVGTFARDLESAATNWIAAGAPAELPRRRVVAAVVALEASHDVRRKPSPLRAPDAQWPDRIRLLEWGATVLRENDPGTASERWYHLASVALLEQSFGFPLYAIQGLEADERLLHAARTRLPTNLRLALAEPVLATEAAGYLGYPLDDLPNAPLDVPLVDVQVVEPPGSPIDLVRRPSPRALPFPVDPHDFRVPLRAAIRGYAALLARPEIGPEAHLRLGALEVYLDQPDLALPHLDAAQPALTDPIVRYAAQFFRGAALTRLGDVQGAEVAFRQALAEVPHAESGTIGLAWLLMLNQHRTEAAALTADELRAARAADPLAAFALGDAHLWETYVGHLRTELATR